MATGPDFRQALAQLQQAMTKVLNGDPSLMKALHSHADDVTSFYGMGGYEKGWEQVSSRWDWAAANLFKGGTARYENLSTSVSGDLAFTVDIERHVLDDGEVNRALRVTHLFRREDGQWRLLHRHGSPLERKAAG
jgi:ketosteroid isomerase-like protein